MDKVDIIGRIHAAQTGHQVVEHDLRVSAHICQIADLIHCENAPGIGQRMGIYQLLDAHLKGRLEHCVCLREIHMSLADNDVIVAADLEHFQRFLAELSVLIEDCDAALLAEQKLVAGLSLTGREPQDLAAHLGVALQHSRCAFHAAG